MIFWFLGCSCLLAWYIFQSPALDYRLIMLGALFPLIEIPFGRPLFFHTLFGAVFCLTLVMLCTQKKRLLRRRFIGFPIGLFFHLVLDSTWMHTRLFWWPLTGFSFQSMKFPEREIEQVPLLLLLELMGIAALLWGYVLFGMSDPGRRKFFLRTGQLDREQMR